jgi:hypothetical protein
MYRHNAMTSKISNKFKEKTNISVNTRFSSLFRDFHKNDKKLLKNSQNMLICLFI